MKIAFYFSGKGTRARKIIRQVDKRELTNLKLLICDNKLNEDLKALEPELRFHSINYVELSEDKKERNLVLSNTILEFLVRYEIDYLFCWGNHILKGELLEKYKYRIINFHPSILPMWPGRFSIDKAKEANSFLFGNTAHFIDEGIDTGPIILQSICHSSVFFEDNDYNDILDHQILMFQQINRWLEDKRIKVHDNKVIIENINYGNVTFIPNLDI